MPEDSKHSHYSKQYKLLNHTFHYDLRKHLFSARIVSTCDNFRILL